LFNEFDTLLGREVTNRWLSSSRSQ